jgi:hypothetical protein
MPTTPDASSTQELLRTVESYVVYVQINFFFPFLPLGSQQKPAVSGL